MKQKHARMLMIYFFFVLACVLTGIVVSVVFYSQDVL